MSEPAIEFKNVSKRFKGNEYDSVSNVSLKIECGEFVTILGTSGSGKTTFLKMINRIHEMSSGQILYFGEDIKTLNLINYRRQIGYVVQQSGLFPHKNVEENISVVPKMLKWDKNRMNARIRELMTLVRLDYETYHTRYPRSLSGGEQQRVGLARALAVNPSLLLMDEPFGAIDAINRSILQKELRELHDSLKNTILFVTHDINEAFLLGDRIIVMDHGKVQQFDTPYNIMTHPTNDYVRKLINTGDPLDKLKVLSVRDGLEEPTENEINEGIRISSDRYLNEVLEIFVRNKCDYLIVEENNNVLGKYTLRNIQEILDV